MIGILGITLAIQVASHSPVARFDPARNAAAALVDSLEAMQLRFFHEWRQVFDRSEQPRMAAHSGRQPDIQVISAHMACWHDGGILPLLVHRGHTIESATSRFVACPSWALVDSVSYDARLFNDEAIDPQYRAAVTQSRASLIRLFDAATRNAPYNDWIVGQLVRLHVDNRDARGALAAARSCGATRWWCTLLTGYALAAGNDLVAADSTFARALHEMPARTRCTWTDVRLLLDSVGRMSYDAVSCDARDAMHETFWWMADPMWSEPANERRVEHFSRTVATTLRAAIARDEFTEWSSDVGGDAHREMAIRYGWPSRRRFVGGESHIDQAHMGYLLVTMRGSNATFEYSGGRVHSVPGWSAITSPFQSKSADWELNDPGTKADFSPLYATSRLSRATIDMAARVSPWWPQEHFKPGTPLVQLRDGQVAHLRRQDGVLFAVAHDLVDTELRRRRGATLDASLIISSRPDSFVTAARGNALVGSTLTMHGLIAARDAVVGIEVLASGEQPGARTRFGITPPRTLAQMRPGDLAVSDPIIIRAPASDNEMPVATEAVLARMAGSTVVPRSSRLGVYWESYGFSPTDSVELAVWIERFTPQGIMRRFGVSLGVATDINTPVAQSWTETEVGRNAHVIPGPVTIIGRSIVLNTGSLQPGDYWLDVVVRKPGRDPVRARRGFTVPER